MTVVDGRGSQGNRVVSDQLWRARAKGVAREAFKKAIDGTLEGDFRKIGKEGIDVPIPKKSVEEPRIYTQGGVRHIVAPGNTLYEPGDKIPRPKQSGGGNGAGHGDDGPSVHIDKEEVLRMLFDGLGLPFLDKKSAGKLRETRIQRAGFASQGPAQNIDLASTRRRMFARHMASSSASWDGIITLLKEKKEILMFDYPEAQSLLNNMTIPKLDYVSKAMEIEILERHIGLLLGRNEECSLEHVSRLVDIDQQLAVLKNTIGNIPFFEDSLDPRYRHFKAEPMPNSKAAMFCLMDVSGSMTEDMVKNANLFYWLLYHMLEVKFGEGNVDVVFIRHTDTAKEVDMETFFNSRDTGGTTVSSALDLTLKIIKERYSDPEWNIYGAQVSDGDNAYNDNQNVQTYLEEIMKISQAYCYLETKNSLTNNSDLWDLYKSFEEKHGAKFKMGKVVNREDVVPIFRELYAETAANFGQQRINAFQPGPAP